MVPRYKIKLNNYCIVHLLHIDGKSMQSYKNQKAACPCVVPVVNTDTEPNRKYRKSGIGTRYRISKKNGFGVGIYIDIPKYRKYRNTVIRYLSSLFQPARV